MNTEGAILFLYQAFVQTAGKIVAQKLALDPLAA